MKAKRILPVIITLAMIIGAMSVSAFAAEADVLPSGVTEESFVNGTTVLIPVTVLPRRLLLPSIT